MTAFLRGSWCSGTVKKAWTTEKKKIEQVFWFFVSWFLQLILSYPHFNMPN